MTTTPVLDFTHLRDLSAAERDSAPAAVSAALEGNQAQDITAWAGNDKAECGIHS